jgi:hypothetical protein
MQQQYEQKQTEIIQNEQVKNQEHQRRVHSLQFEREKQINEKLSWKKV